MPTQTTYTFSISTNFPNHAMDSGRLTQEIASSTIIIALNDISTSGDNCNITFKDSLSSADQTTLNSIIAAHTGLPLTSANQTVSMQLAGNPLSPDGRIRISSEKPSGSRISFYSVDFTNKTTWYPSSVRNIEAVIANVSDGYYYLSHNSIIDTFHGNITLEDNLKDSDGYSYRVSVVVDGVSKIEQDPHYGTGCDYIVDYYNGIIIPLTSWNPLGNSSVVITYHYATIGNYIIKPNPGTTLTIDISECQFSTDIQILDTVVFAVYGYSQCFAPQLGLPTNTLIPIMTFKYKSINDYLNDSLKSYPIYPKISPNTWRGMNCESTIFSWDYISSTTLYASQGMQINMYLEHNQPFGGFFATISLYCLSNPE